MNPRPSTETPCLRNGMFLGFPSHRTVAEVDVANRRTAQEWAQLAGPEPYFRAERGVSVTLEITSGGV